jgi:NADP-dependent aldehyde dehydrogenase
VICKGHAAHPGTRELVARAVLAAAAETGMPDGVFSLLNGNNRALGQSLVADARVAAAAFTGSRGGGTALMAIANSRSVPIPVYAEMSSINPVLLLPTALEARAEDLGKAFVASLTMGAGQFCTNPGLVIALAGPALDRFASAAADALGQSTPATMLTPRIYQAYVEGVDTLKQNKRVTTLADGGASGSANCGRGALFSTNARDFLAHQELSGEVFGAASLIVRCDSEAEMAETLQALEGQLTATLQMDGADHALAGRLLPILETKAGRIIANGWPTGVEVCHAMVHGGPFPATSDTRTTSVGTLAIERFLRPVCYQDIPAALLPSALAPDNPLKLRRLVDGAWAAEK